MPDSILTTTKEAIGITSDVTVFDGQLLMHINSVFSDLNQLGVGPDVGFQVGSAADTWDEMIGTDSRLNSVKSYTYMRVKMLFDPPTLGYLITAYEKAIKEAEWRINVAREDIDHPAPVTPEVDPLLEDGFQSGYITSY